MAKLDYVELPAPDVAGERAFYERAFGWKFTDYGPQYSAHEEHETQLGLNGTDTPTRTVLPLIRVEDIEAAYAAVVAAGGSITVETIEYPGGKRFLFADPAGLEMGCYQPDQT
ncbi:VOC family protein [Aurantiacibacter gilvus]|uniref:VOC family protein n=1 Tax=Aurantiacibacter gilvus TaxID=3139141 RepID=A0ABU9ICG2_9SPHN